MTLTADRYAKIAQSYYRAAADPLVPYDKRKDYARVAEWFHNLSTPIRRGISGPTLRTPSGQPRPVIDGQLPEECPLRSLADIEIAKLNVR
jgi:hypothetical protein